MKKKNSKRTITQFMIEFFNRTPDAKFVDVPMKSIMRIKPDSAFNIYHFCWFKQQILKEDGRYYDKFQALQKV